MPAKHSFRSIELRGSCLSCASGLLAAKVSRGAGLGASDGVRMVWWGFRALKTPEERLHRRRFSVGRHTIARIRRSMDKPWTNTGQTLCIYGANLEHLLSRTQDGYKLKTRRLQKDCMSTARGQHFESKRTAD